MDEEKLKRRKQRAKKDENLKQLAEIAKELGDVFFQAGQMEDALKEYTEQLDVCQTLQDEFNSALAHRMIGEIHTNIGNYEEALSHLMIYLNSVKAIANLIEQQRAYATLGRTYYCLAEASEELSDKREKALTDAKKAYTKSLKLCDKLENTNVERVEIMMMRARLLLNLGLILDAQKEPIKAIELIEMASQLCQKHKLNDDLHRIYIALGALHERQENFDDALKHYNLSAQLSNDSLNCATAKVNTAELLLKLGRWSEARKILVALYVNYNVHSLNETISRLLKIVASIDKYELELCSENDNKKLMKLYENLGDASAAGYCYFKAVEYYQKMLICAEKEPLVYRKKISAALVSLAQTLMDDKRFTEALIYARRDLEFSNKDDRKTCRSALFLANLLTHIKDSSDKEIRNVYQLALSSATTCHDISLQVIVLKEMHEYFHEVGAIEEAENINKKLNALKMIRVTDSDSSNNSEADESIDAVVDINLDNLSDVEEELQKKGEKSKVTRRTQKRGCVVKRNEKGETKLHVACINNNIEEVRNLLIAGHPIDVRDYCGWTPLHEASNFGYVEIAELLIEHGANINDPGGSQCGNITPLHDAASCGNFTMINLLIARGADITLKTKAGETVLDCLENWRSRLEQDRCKKIVEWTDNDEKEYKLIRNKLRLVLPSKQSKLSIVDQPLIDEDDNFSQSTRDHRSASPDIISAGEDYRRTIESLKNRNYLKSSPSFSKVKDNGSSRMSQTPLIDNEQQLVDDWLEDDLFTPASTSTNAKRAGSDDIESPTPKRRSFNSTTAPIFNNDKNIQRPKSNKSSFKYNKNSSKKLYAKSKQKSLFISGFSKNISASLPTPVPIPINTVENDEIETCNRNIGSITFSVIVNNTVMNIKIKHSEKCNNLFNNLTNEIIKKIYQNTGCTTKIVLTTTDGEELLAENLLNLVYTNQENIIKLHGQLIDLVTPKLTERYKIICTALNVGIDDDVKQLKPLRACEHTEILRLKDNDENINTVALLKSLEYEKNLSILDLSTCCLFNMDELLNHALGQLSQLQELHLSGCDIDHNCLSKIERFPITLRILDLSYNPLGIASETKLSELIANLRFLQVLNLQNCQIKKLLFNLMIVCPSLINLDISWNKFDNTETDCLLQRQLINLNLSQSFPRPIATTEMKLIALETLETLELGGCNINDMDVSYLLDKCKNLSKLILNNNPKLSHVSLEKLLEYKPTLSLIDVTGCQKITNTPKNDLIIDNPSICTMMACMELYVCDLWELLWQGHVKQYRMPHGIVVFKPLL